MALWKNMTNKKYLKMSLACLDSEKLYSVLGKTI